MNTIAPANSLFDALKEQFAAIEQQNAGAVTGLTALRRTAFNHFIGSGFPTTRNEEWKYTNVSKLINGQTEFSAGAGHTSLAPSEIKKLHYEGLKANILVFVNGKRHHNSGVVLSPSYELELLSVAEADEKRVPGFHENFGRLAHSESDAFTALNTAFVQEGTYIRVPEGTTPELPVLLYYITDCTSEPVLQQPRNLIVIGKNAHLNVTEHYTQIGNNQGFTNAVTEIVLEEGASVEYYKFGAEAEAGNHIGSTFIYLNTESKAKTVTLNRGGALVRNNLNFILAGERSDARMYGLYVGRNKSHIDNHTSAEHQAPNTFSDELYKGVLAESSRGVFNGKIMVRQAAQKTNAFQSNRNILLSDGADVNTKPQLEIFADDVKCSHGATIGPMEEEPLFYLQSRGIGAEAARGMLLQAFTADVLAYISIPEIRAQEELLLQEYLTKQAL